MKPWSELHQKYGKKIGTMLQDILRAMFQKPITEQYPFERHPTPMRLRGQLHWNPEKCTGCCLCSMECPAKALELITLDRATKRFVLRYHVDRCTFCEQCVRNCRFGCLEMSNKEWELATQDKRAFEVHYGNAANVETVLANLAKENADPSSE